MAGERNVTTGVRGNNADMYQQRRGVGGRFSRGYVQNTKTANGRNPLQYKLAPKRASGVKAREGFEMQADGSFKRTWATNLSSVIGRATGGYRGLYNNNRQTWQ